LEYDNLNKKRNELQSLFTSINEEFNKIAPKDFEKSSKDFMFKYNKDKKK